MTTPTTLHYRVRVRDAGDTADALVITSVRGGANPYIAEAPSGDGQEVDPLTGAVRTGSYTLQVADAITGGTSRVFTSQLFDAAGRQKLLSRRSYIEFSTNSGSSWTGMVAGYLQSYRLVDAVTWELQIGDTRRVEQTQQVFDGTSTSFAARGCIFGGPIVGGPWGPIPDRGGWKFKVRSVTALSASAHLVLYDFVNGYRGVNDPLTSKFQDALGLGKDATACAINSATRSYYSPSVSPYAYQGAPGVVARISELTGGATKGLFTPAVIYGVGNSASFPELVNQLDWNLNGAFSLLWPAAVSVPSAGDVHSIALYTQTPTDVSPIYLDMHPVDIVTALWADAGIAFDATAAANAKALLGATLRVAMRVTQSMTLLDFLETQIFGPFGISARTNSAGALELFTTRLKQTGVPAATIGTDDLQGASEVIFDNDEATVVSSLRFKTETYWAANLQDVAVDHPLDNVYVAKSEVVVVDADTSTYSTKEIVYELTGMIHDVSGVVADMAAFTTSVAQEMFDRFGRGSPVGEFVVLRGSDPGAQIGDELYLQPAHLPNLNKRLGDDPSVGARIVQIVRRTESPAGPAFKYVDAGSDQQPVNPAPTISIAANAVNVRSIAEFTITNAAAINATGLLTTAVQWATGGSSPANGVQFTRYTPGNVPTTAVQLPAVGPGTKVWARARTEQDGRRPSAWTAWVSVTLTGVGTPTLGSVLGLGFRTIQFSWTGANATDLTDFFVASPVPVAAGAFVIGQLYTILSVGTTNFVAIGAASNTVGLPFTATGAGSGSGTAAIQPAAWAAYFAATAPAGGSSLSVDTPPPGGVGSYYFYAFGHRDPMTGQRGTLLTGLVQTSNRKTSSRVPGIAQINLGIDQQGSLPSGVALWLQRVDTLDLRIQRAPDASGAPGAWIDIATVRGSMEVYVDLLPVDGKTYWYRTTHDGPSNTDSFSSPVAAISQSVPAVLQPPGFPSSLFISVKDAPYYAYGDGVTDDTVAIKGAAAAARAMTPPAMLVFPQGSYLVSGAGPIVELADGMHICGFGQPIIKFTGTGALFNVKGKQRVEIDHLQIEGTFAASTYAIRHEFSVVGAISNHYHHLRITNFGNGAQQNIGAIQIDSDSQGLELGPHLFMGNLSANVAITAPTDSLWFHDNILSVPAAYPNGPVRALDATGGLGSAGMVVERNNITVEGWGTVRVAGAGVWAFRDNDVESLQTISNASNAGFELLYGSFTLDGNAVNHHYATGASYCLYFADGVDGSSEAHGLYAGFNSKAVRVAAGATVGNTYGPSQCTTVPSDMYSADVPGIIQPAGQSHTGYFQGFAAPPLTGFGRNGPAWDGPVNLAVSESGANNALVVTGYFPTPLPPGFRLVISTNHSLQAGANTISYNGAGAVALKSSRNFNDIVTPYAAGGWITVFWSGSLWLDASQ